MKNVSNKCFKNYFNKILWGVQVSMLTIPLAWAQQTSESNAKTYPQADRVLTIVVPFAAGGPTDKVARDLALSLHKYLPVGRIEIVNKVGAGGTTGAGYVAKANADGYTLLLYHIGIATSRSFYPGLPYNPASDFKYLGVVTQVPMTLVARKNLKAKTIKDIRIMNNTSESKIKYANAGRASASHLCGMMLQYIMGTKFNEVSYSGTGPAMTALMSDQVDLMCDQTTNTTEPIGKKEIKAYAVTTTNRVNTPELRHLPTLQEMGFYGFDLSIWHGLYAPSNTPDAVAATLNTALKKALKDPEFVRRQKELGAVVAAGDLTTPQGHLKFTNAETIKWTMVINRLDRNH